MALPSPIVPAAPWVVCPRPNPAAALRLFCLPYAGVGPSIYRSWASALPSTVELRLVQLPGREGRWREAPLTTMRAIADALSTAIVPHLDGPYAFYGHSLGALTAFEVTRRLRAAGKRLPQQLFVGAHRAPQLPNPHPEIRSLGDSDFIDELRRRYGGIPQAVLDNPELLELMLPCLRADFAAYETYEYADEAPLDVPISAFGGDEDRYVRTPEVAGWRDQTCARFRLHVISGDHFFVQQHRDRIIAAIFEDLAAAAREAPVAVART